MIRALRSISTAITIPILYIVMTLFISCSNDNPVTPDEPEPVPADWVLQNPYPQGLTLMDVEVVDAMTATAVGIYGTVIYTVDGGETWELRERRTDMSLYRISFATPDIGTGLGGRSRSGGGSVWRTVDGGATWEKQMSRQVEPYRVWMEDVCFAHPDTGFISCSDGKVLLTTDGGNSWVDRRVSYRGISGMSFCNPRNGMVLGSRTVLRTGDGGITWEAGGWESNYYTYSISMFDPLNAYVTAVGYGAPGTRMVVMYRTTDGGNTWQNMYHSRSLGERVTSVDERIVVAVGSEGVITRSDDGGVTWEPRDSGTDKYFSDVSFSGVDLGIAVGEDGVIVRSLDGGDTWEVVSRGSRMDLNDVFFTDPFNGTAVGLWGAVLRTSDGGNTWNEQSTVQANPYELTLSTVRFSDDENGIAVGYSGIIISTADGGGTWTMRAMSEDPGMALFGLDLIDENIGTAVGEMGRIIRTVDRGVTWMEQDATMEQWLYDVDFLDADRGIAVGSNGTVVLTEDGGEAWRKISLDQAYQLRGVAVLDENRAFAVGWAGQIIRTTDGGDRWFRWPSGTGSDLYSVSFLDGNNGIIVGDNVILRTFDGGETWESQEIPPGVDLRGSQCIDIDIMTAVGLDGAIIRTDRATD